jgi:hypothetical protein
MIDISNLGAPVSWGFIVQLVLVILPIIVAILIVAWILSFIQSILPGGKNEPYLARGNR